MEEKNDKSRIGAIIGLVGSVVGIIAFFTGKNYPDLIAKEPDKTVISAPTTAPVTSIPTLAPTPKPAPAPTPSPTSPPPSGTDVEVFTENSTYSKRNSVAVAHSQKLSSCETCVKRLRDNGYNAFLYEETNKSGYTILIGVFGTAQEAKDFAEYLHTQPEVKGVALDHAYATSKIRLSDSVASRYSSPWY